VRGFLCGEGSGEGSGEGGSVPFSGGLLGVIPIRTV